MSKADYVRFAAAKHAPNNRHTCHWPGCEKAVPPAMWGCRAHWFKLPASLRARVWATYQPGQEISKTPNAAYLAVANDVQDWIAAQGMAARSDATGTGAAEGNSPVAKPCAPTTPGEAP